MERNCSDTDARRRFKFARESIVSTCLLLKRSIHAKLIFIMFVDINKISKLEIVIASNRKNENIYEEIFCTQIFCKPFEL